MGIVQFQDAGECWEENSQCSVSSPQGATRWSQTGSPRAEAWGGAPMCKLGGRRSKQTEQHVERP